MLELYDPKTNTVTQTTYEYLEELTGISKRNLMTYRSKGVRIRKINCYIIHPKTTVEQRRQWYSKIKYSDEHWKYISGSDNQFLISNYGRFKRVYKNGPKFLLPYLKKTKGYLEIRVKFQGEYKKYQVSKLVAFHFLDKPKPGEVLRHKNGIKTDNYAGNLEWIDKKSLGKITGYRSRSKPVALICPETGEVLEEYRSAREAGRKNFMSYQAVLDVCNGVRKCTVDGYVFKYVENYD